MHCQRTNTCLGICIGRNTTHETEQALKTLMAVVTKCTVKELAANETERAVMAINAAVTQCGAIWNFL